MWDSLSGRWRIARGRRAHKVLPENANANNYQMDSDMRFVAKFTCFARSATEPDMPEEPSMSSTPSLSHSPPSLPRLAGPARRATAATRARRRRAVAGQRRRAGRQPGRHRCRACGRTGRLAAGARRTGADHGADPQRALRPRTQGAVSRSDGLCQWADGPGGLAGYRPAPVSGVGTLSSPLPRRHRGYPAQHPGVRPAGRGGAQGVPLPRPATSAPGNRWSSACGLPSRMPCWPCANPAHRLLRSSMRRSMP